LRSRLSKADIEIAQSDISQGKTAKDAKTEQGHRSIVRGGEGIARSAIMSLSACYSWAVDRGMVDDNPCLRVKKPKPKKLERFLTREEAINLFAVIDAMESSGELDDLFADMARLLLLTGARKSEIQDLQWSELDFERHLIRLPRGRSKTGEKTIPLANQALRILKARRRQAERSAANDEANESRAPSKLVFQSRFAEGPPKGLQKAWERVQARWSRRCPPSRSAAFICFVRCGKRREPLCNRLGHRPWTGVL
jgi:integrase